MTAEVTIPDAWATVEGMRLAASTVGEDCEGWDVIDEPIGAAAIGHCSDSIEFAIYNGDAEAFQAAASASELAEDLRCESVVLVGATGRRSVPMTMSRASVCRPSLVVR